MQNTVFKKGIIFAIIILFVGASVVSSTDYFLEEKSLNYSSLKSGYSLEENLSHNTTWYSFYFHSHLGTGFHAYYPNNTIRFREWGGEDFLSGGTWTNDGRLFFCMFGNGTLYEVDPVILDAWIIGEENNSLNGLAYNPVNEKLYGASSTDLYEINISTGEQTYIGAFKTGTTIIAIACDLDGIMYAWDVKFIGDSYLFKIDIETGEATVIGSIEKTLCYAQDGSFDYEPDILYLAANIYSPEFGGYLLECDEDTGEIIDSWGFEGEQHPSAFAISYEINITSPFTDILFDPPEPDGDNDWYVSNVTVKLNATDNSGVLVTYYRINGGEWVTYDSPFIVSEDGEDILIEYYSVDTIGNVEDVKSSTLDIDKTLPVMSVELECFKEGCCWYVKFIVNASDETSGLFGGISFYINEGLHEINSSPDGSFYGFVIQWKKAFSSCNFKFICCDGAGNEVNVSVNGSDIESFSSIKVGIRLSNNLWFLRQLNRLPIFQRLFWWLM